MSDNLWWVLTTIRFHHYEARIDLDPEDEVHPCRCGWRGDWSEYQRHLAQQIVAVVG